MTSAAAPAEQAFLQRFSGLAARLPGDGAARRLAAESFARLGLPGPRQEAWKFTSLRRLRDMAFAEPKPTADASPALLDRLDLPDVQRLVFVDGRFSAELSTAEVEAHFALSPEFGRLVRPDRDVFAALNTMLAEDGATIAIPDGVDAGTLLLVSLATDGGGRPVALHPRHRIALGAGARLVLLDVTWGTGTYFHNPVTEIVVGAGARLTHFRLQEESDDAVVIGTVYADLAAGSEYESLLLNAGAALSRQEVHARIGGPGAVLHLNCAQALRGAQHGDFTTVVAHDAPNGRSRQTVRNVLDGAARGVFQGRIEVARIAQKTDGYQMNHALLLSANAEMDSKPELRINADDVKCSHGATVGDLNADQFFYLRSRGVPAAEARSMLIRGFLAGSAADISDDTARAMFDRALDRWWERQDT